MDSKPDNNLKSYNVLPHDGYVTHRSEKGIALPNCCPRHRKIFDDAKEWWVASNSEKDAIAFALKTVLHVAYTEHCILKCISYKNAYEIISEFIEYNVFSFGSRKDYQPYIFGLFGFMTREGPDDFRFAHEASIRLDSLIFMWYMNSLVEVDIYMLKEAFNKWYDIFPFELSIFKGLKENYDFFYELLRYDSGDFTPETFREALNDLTNKILTQIDTRTLLEQGVLDEPSKVKLELIISQRRLKANKGYLIDNSTEQADYYRVINKWFKDEKKFLDEITLLVKPAPPVEVQIYSDNVIAIWDKLQPYKLSTFLQSKDITDDQFKGLLEKHSGREIMPYSIALFHEIGYLTYFFDSFCKNKGDRVQKLMKVFNRTDRKISGNITILGAKSGENPSEYPSITYIETVKKDLKGLK